MFGWFDFVDIGVGWPDRGEGGAACTGKGAARAAAAIPGPPLSERPVTRPGDWVDLVNAALPGESAARVRVSVDRRRPCGHGEWLERAVETLGLSHTLRRPGRPAMGEARLRKD